MHMGVHFSIALHELHILLSYNLARAVLPGGNGVFDALKREGIFTQPGGNCFGSARFDIECTFV